MSIKPAFLFDLDGGLRLSTRLRRGMMTYMYAYPPEALK